MDIRGLCLVPDRRVALRNLDALHPGSRRGWRAQRLQARRSGRAASLGNVMRWRAVVQRRVPLSMAEGGAAAGSQGDGKRQRKGAVRMLRFPD